MSIDYRKMKLGRIKDVPDNRDKIFQPDLSIRAALPKKVDLTKKMPPVYNQGELGSCTANAIGALFEFCKLKAGKKTFMPSRLFIYYNERAVEDTIRIDNGAQIRTGMKVCTKIGICAEDIWPYSDDNKLFKKKPTKNCFTAAKDHQVLKYERVSQKLEDLKTCLASGFPFTFGFEVYDSFYDTQVETKGIVKLPKADEPYHGGHAVACVGYDDTKKVFIVRNSWGADWAKGGYCMMPYSYLTNPELSDDFWVMHIVE